MMWMTISAVELHLLAESMGVQLQRHTGGPPGWYDHYRRIISTRRGQSIGQYKSVLAHELGHAAHGTRDINIDELSAIADALDISLVELIRKAEQEINPDTRNELEERRRKARMSTPSDSMPEGAVAYSGPDEDAERYDVDDD